METLSALFRDPQVAHQAAGALLDHGLREEHLPLVTLAKDAHDPEHVRGTAEKPESEVSTTTPADAAAGAAIGAGTGLGLGAVAMAVALFVPGFGWVTGGGALATALLATLGTTAAGAVTGGVTGYLMDMGMPADVAQDLEHVVGDEGAILSVDLAGTLTSVECEEILAKYGNPRLVRHHLAVTKSQG